MQIQISSKHLPLTPSIEGYIEKKVEKFDRYFNRIQAVEVVIDKEKTDYTIELITDVEHHDPFVARANNEDLYACIDQGVDRAVRQLRDHKSKLRDNKHHTPTAGNEP